MRMFLRTRWTTMAASSGFFPSARPRSWTSLSRWPQKNSGSSWGLCRPDLTRATRPPVAVSSLQLTQTRAECMMALRIQQAAGERERSGNCTLPLVVGWPRECPFWVASVLCWRERGRHHRPCEIGIEILTFWQFCCWLL